VGPGSRVKEGCNASAAFSQREGNPFRAVNSRVSNLRAVVLAPRLNERGPMHRESLHRLGCHASTRDHLWEQNFHALERFSEHHGHCSVPQSYANDLKLARWVSNQRYAFARGGVLPDRVRRLKAIGFVFDSRGGASVSGSNVNVTRKICGMISAAMMPYGLCPGANATVGLRRGRPWSIHMKVQPIGYKRRAKRV